MGVMTLAVMSRASLGHTGRPLVASTATQGLYLLLVIGAVARICAAFHPDLGDALLHTAAGAWAGAFLGFSLTYWKVFTRPRISG